MSTPPIFNHYSFAIFAECQHMPSIIITVGSRNTFVLTVSQKRMLSHHIFLQFSKHLHKYEENKGKHNEMSKKRVVKQHLRRHASLHFKNVKNTYEITLWNLKVLKNTEKMKQTKHERHTHAIKWHFRKSPCRKIALLLSKRRKHVTSAMYALGDRVI